MSLARERKKHEGKTPEEQCKAWKWVRVKKGLTRRLPYHVPTKEGMIDKVPKEEWWLQYKRTWSPKKQWTKRKSWDSCAPPPHLLPKVFKRWLYVATLTLGSQPRQGLAKVRTKYETQKSHFMVPRVQESEGMNPHTPKWAPTLGVGVSMDF